MSIIHRKAIADFVPGPSLPVATLAGLLARLVRLHDRYQQRLDLAELDDRMLADIGVTPAQARRECARSFWD